MMEDRYDEDRDYNGYAEPGYSRLLDALIVALEAEGMEGSELAADAVEEIATEDGTLSVMDEDAMGILDAIALERADDDGMAPPAVDVAFRMAMDIPVPDVDSEEAEDMDPADVAPDMPDGNPLDALGIPNRGEPSAHELPPGAGFLGT